MSLKIIGTGRALPEFELDNHALSELVDTNDEWIRSRTGIESRRICKEESLTDLAALAGARALAKAGLDAGDLDRIICATIAGDYLTPSLACAVSRRLGASCPAFDLNAACSGFLFALDAATAFLDAGRAKNILIISAEQMSKHADWTDRATCVLFGDGAGACVVTRGEALEYLSLMSTGDVDLLNLPCGSGNSPFQPKRAHGYLHMQGQEVFKFAVSAIDSGVKAAMDALGLTPDQIDLYLLHQANKRIIDYARAKLKQPEEKFPTNIARYGNMSSATIPILMDELVESGQIGPGDRLLLSAFGAGLTAGIGVITWDASH